MADLLEDDLSYVVLRIPRDVRKLMREKGAIVAGGYVRSQISREKPSDIDIFGPDMHTLEQWAKDLALERKGDMHTTDNAYTVLAPPRLPVQFIHRWTYRPDKEITGPTQQIYELLNRVIKDFDFTIAQAAIGWLPGTEEEEKGQYVGLVSERYYADLAAKRLVYTEPKREEDPGGSMMRVRKFLAAGYRIGAKQLGLVISRLIQSIDFDQVRKAARNSDQEPDEMFKQVVIGLLREVDPLTVIDGMELVAEEERVEGTLLQGLLRPRDDDGKLPWE